jgi:amino acid adenylation domain-containing protein
MGAEEDMADPGAPRDHAFAPDVRDLAERLGVRPDVALVAALLVAAWPYALGRSLVASAAARSVSWEVGEGEPDVKGIVEALRGAGLDDAWRSCDLDVCVDGAPSPMLALAFHGSDGQVLRTALDGVVVEGLAATVERLGRGPLTSVLCAAPAAHRSLLREWNGTERPYRRGVSIPDIVAGFAEATPDRVAVRHGVETLTYGELDARATRVAASLLAGGLARGEVVPVLLGRESQLAWILLGVLKAGGAYAVLDPEWPTRRLRELIASAGAQRIIVGPAVGPLGPPRSTPREVLRSGRSGTAMPIIQGGDACSVFFTSGSTSGRPKGVVGTHRGTVRAVVDAGYGRLDATSVWLQAAALPWDGLTLELWGALLNGGSVVLSTEGVAGPRYLRRVIADGVNTVWLTASVFNLIVDEDLAAFTGLRIVLTGGEPLSPEHASRFLDRHPDIELVNGYGPAEATVFATTQRVRRTAGGCSTAVGRCLPNTRVHVVRGLSGDRPWQAPIGALGEICIAGDGLGIGYLEPDPERRFRTVDIDGTPERIYRTGDRGSWLPDGTLTVRGRIDRQLKIRGHRVDPGEVEAMLAEHPEVAEAAVVVRPGTDPSLVAFLRPRPGASPQASIVRSWVGRRLPAHAVPDRLIVRADLPRGATGKVDRTMLAATLDQASSGVRGVTPGATIDRLVTTVLHRHVPGDADIFDYGATSLTATRLAARVSQATNRDVGVADVLRERTPDRLGELVRRLPARTGESRAPDRSLSRAQRRFWVNEHLSPGSSSLLVVSAHLLERCPDVAALAGAVDDVVERHAQLRTQFDDEEDVQRVTDGAHIGLEVQDTLRRLPDDLLARQLADEEGRERFDLRRQAVRFNLTRLPGGSALFVLAAHHIVIDGWSEAILLRDLEHAYAARSVGEAPRWTGDPLDYGVHVAEERAWLATADAEAQRRWWREALLDVEHLPWRDGQDHAGERDDVVGQPSHIASGSSRLQVAIEALSDVLVQVVGARGRIAVATVVSGRDDLRFAETVGAFLNTVCVPVDLSSAADPAERLVDALAHRRLPFDEVLAALRPPRTDRHPVCQVMLVAQDYADRALQLPGCQGTRLSVPQSPEPFDIVVELWPAGAGFRAEVAVADGYGHPGLARRLAMRLGRSMTAAASRAAQPLAAADDGAQ